MSGPIVLQVCQELRVKPEDFFSNLRARHITRARRLAIERLMASGLSMRSAARIIRRNYSTVRYWVHPKLRDYHIAKGRQNYARLKEVNS